MQVAPRRQFTSRLSKIYFQFSCTNYGLMASSILLNRSRRIFDTQCRKVPFVRSLKTTIPVELRGGSGGEENINVLAKSRNQKVEELLSNAALGNNKTSQQDNWATSPYPEGAVVNKFNRDQSKKVKRQGKDPNDTSILMFPGQGTQFVGMAKDFTKIPEARDMFDIASQVLGYDLMKLCNEGPARKLDQTKYAQPAIAVTSLASLEKLRESYPSAIDNCVAACGFSLGEISALIFAGAIPFDKGIRLIQVRAELMQTACDENPSGMATVLYGPDSKLGDAVVKAKEWCIERGVNNPECSIANYLYPHCKVIAGSLEALSYIEKNAKQFKLRRVKRLPVSGAFHTNLMEAALEPFREALKRVNLSKPLINVHSNVNGLPYQNATHIEHQLPKQIVSPVKWEQLLHIIYERPQGSSFPKTFEVAPGNSLTTILKQVNAKAWDTCVVVDKSYKIE